MAKAAFPLLLPALAVTDAVAAEKGRGLVDYILLGLTVAGLGVLFVPAFGFIRDQMRDAGFFREGGWIERSHLRKLKLPEIFDPLRSESVRRVVHETFAEAGLQPGFLRKTHRLVANHDKVVLQRPDIALIKAMPRWLHDLAPANYYKQTPFYIDMMDAMFDFRSGGADPELLSALLASWLDHLSDNGVLDADCLLTTKSGNSHLARDLAATRGLPLIGVKRADDKSAIAPGASVHVIDLEGMSALLRSLSQNPPGKPLSAVFVDDSCNGGSSLIDAVGRFNQFVATNNYAHLFGPVNHAVTLFRFVPDNATADRAERFEKRDIELHALIAVGSRQAKKLKQMGSDKKIEPDPGFFKQDDPFACKQSLAILS